MHRIRTWARTKAHGPAPLVHSESRRSGSGNRPTRSDTGLQSSGDAPAAPVDAAAESTVPTVVEDEKAERANKNVAVRFFLTLRDILVSSYLNILLVFVPVGIAVKVTNQSASVIFAMNAIAIVPLAGLLSHATESVARRLGDTIGALMNVTFGNAVELIIFIALVKDEIRIVQASLLGSILANLLLILGMCFLFGGLRFREQIYNSTVTQMSACLLSLSVSSLLLPTAFHASFSNLDTADDKVLQVSRGTSVVLLLVYILYLVFQLNSHSYMYESMPKHIIERHSVPGPAASYWNSSSSSDSSSSSSSDTDDSSASHSKSQKIKRAFKGKRSRKHSVILAGDEEVAESTAAVAPAAESSSDAIEPIADGALVADDEADEAPKKKSHRKRKHKHRKRSPSGDNTQNQVEEAGGPTTQAVSSDVRRVDFAVAPDVEAQTDTRPKPFSLRAMRPALPKTISQNVFTRPPPQNPPQGMTYEAARPHNALRRTTSLPTQQPSYRNQPGSIPPIMPIMVNTPRVTETAEDTDDEEGPHISRTTAIMLLLGSTGLVALCAEFMVDSINEIVPKDEDSSGISEAFIGLILLPIVGNAAEHVTAVSVAMKNKMDLAIGVALGSSIQIALFVTPLIVVLGWIMKKEMTLFFTLFETVSMFVSAFIVNFLVLDGRSNYLEGALLCSAYVIIAVAAFFYPSAHQANALGGGDGNGTNGTEHLVEGGARLLARGMANLADFW